jgi:hypothetical protein
MELLDNNEWPIGAQNIANICGVTVRTAQRWISGQTRPPQSAITLIQLTQRQRIMPETWPNHWRIAADALDIGHLHICLQAHMIEHYFYSVSMWSHFRSKLPAIDARIQYLQSKLPKADVTDLADYRAMIKEIQSREFYALSRHTTG